MRRWLPALGLCCACAHAATECPQPARVQLRQPVVVTAQEQAALQQLPQPLRVVAVGTPPLALYDQRPMTATAAWALMPCAVAVRNWGCAFISKAPSISKCWKK